MENKTADLTPMSQIYDYYWIDDDPARESASQLMGESLSKSIWFINLQGENLSEKLAEIKARGKPRLVILDHHLIMIEQSTLKKGSSIAEILREDWHDVPMVCVTGAKQEVQLTDEMEQYDSVIESSDLSNNYSMINLFETTFSHMASSQIEGIEDIYTLLQVPEIDRERLASILPTHLKMDFSDKSIRRRIAYWVNNVLRSHPGFLYDRMWTATLLGLKLESLEKFESLFEEAKYKGIFRSSSSEPPENRWWKSQLQMILSEYAKDTNLIYPWQQGRLLPGIEAEDYSKCDVSGEDYPEIIAYTDGTRKERAPVLMKFTRPDPQGESRLFFEEMRIVQVEK